ncbi:methyltransferase domain-containing protein [Hyphomicrobium sp.]|uniref:methyltransferase domain-containing protein n=1 Tax=Hyphomicrobium sp. TaxID=82 RepID=UPI002FE3B62E
MSIDVLVRKLPEAYQPIFNHPEISAEASRGCMDRLKNITTVYKEIEKYLGRRLRVLDLGCAQGFFSFSLAELGATVHGVDYLRENINLCQAIAVENPDLTVSFEKGRIEDCVDNIGDNQYDIVLGLSVFHHIAHDRGIEFTQSLIGEIGKKTTVGLFELALAEESLYWGISLPKFPRDLLKNIAFSHEIFRHKTHLSSLARPLYFASNHYWFLGGKLEKFEQWTDVSNDAFPDVHQGSRRFYFGKYLLAKIIYLDKSDTYIDNSNEFRKEVAFLRNPPENFSAPNLHLWGNNEREAWLVRNFVAGEPLIRRILHSLPYDPHKVIHDILRQLILLEEAGLYHNDLRPWNVIMDKNNRAKLIDYGAIDDDGQDCVWPRDIYLSFLIFLREVLDRKLGSILPFRPPWFNPDELPEPYRSAAWKLLTISAPDRGFKQFSYDIDRGDASACTPFSTPQNMLPTILSAMTAISDATAEFYTELLAKRHRIAEPEPIAAHLAEIDRLNRHILETDAALAAMRASTSWRITAPLRAVSRAVRLQLHGRRWFAQGVRAWITFKPGSRPHRFTQRTIEKTARFVLARPRLAGVASRILRLLPRLDRCVRDTLGIGVPAGPPFFFRPGHIVIAPTGLPPRVRRIYTDLRAATNGR